MRFSDQFGVVKTDSDDWFDPVLSLDTGLFLDPFLVYANERGDFLGSHAEIIRFFNDVFSDIAKTKGDATHLLWRRSLSLLVFPEVDELCLGYSAATTRGAGSGRGFADAIAAALWEAVSAGVKKLSHFEEVGILREGIGPDRISDITANLLRRRLTSYTEAVCRAHDITCTEVRHPRGEYNQEFRRWMPLSMKVPRNPYSGQPILLVPQEYLRDLPTISAQPFWDYCYSNEGETLRNDFGADIARHVDKETIVDFARDHPEVRTRYVKYTERRGSRAYDYGSDRKGLVGWYTATARYCSDTPLALAFTSVAGFETFNDEILREFGNYVTNNAGWKLLWNDDGTPKSEEAAQLLFLGIVKHYCKANDIDISREANIGRGPVDFKTSQGYKCRALLELKLAKNTKFWSGLSKQLPKYLEAEDVNVGYFVVIVQTEVDLKRLDTIREAAEEVNAATPYRISVFVVDAREAPLSASKL